MPLHLIISLAINTLMVHIMNTVNMTPVATELAWEIEYHVRGYEHPLLWGFAYVGLDPC